MPIPQNDVPITRQNNFRFWSPYDPTFNAAPSVTLTNLPNIGNTEDLSVTRLYDQTSSGQPVIFYDDTLPWPTSDINNWSFTFLSGYDKSLLMQFITQTVGLEIGVWDHEGLQWRGFILNPGTSFTSVISRGTCEDQTWSVNIQFQGEMVSTWQ